MLPFLNKVNIYKHLVKFEFNRLKAPIRVFHELTHEKICLSPCHNFTHIYVQINILPLFVFMHLVFESKLNSFYSNSHKTTKIVKIIVKYFSSITITLLWDFWFRKVSAWDLIQV